MLLAAGKKGLLELDKKREKAEDAAREPHKADGDLPEVDQHDMQEKTFTKWANLLLERGGVPPVTSLFKDFRDGNKLLHLLEVVSDQKLPREKGKSKTSFIANLNRAIQLLQDSGVRVSPAVNSADLYDGGSKGTLHLMWSIVHLYWALTIKDLPEHCKNAKMEHVILNWCKHAIRNVELPMDDLGSCWRDGLAFSALIYSFKPDLLDYEAISAMDEHSRISRIFHIISHNLGIPRLLDSDDVACTNVDRKSVVTYLMCLFEALPHNDIPLELFTGVVGEPPMLHPDVTAAMTMETESSSGTETPPAIPQKRDQSGESTPQQQTPPTTTSVDPPASAQSSVDQESMRKLSTYNKRVEELFAWILGAEDRQESGTKAQINDLNSARKYFKQHQELTQVMIQNQKQVDDVLTNGYTLCQDDLVMNCAGGSDEADILKNQVSMLGQRWERLDQRASDWQNQLRSKLNTFQNSYLNETSKWIDAVEQEIDETAPVALDSKLAEQQIENHAKLQERIAAEQLQVNELSNIVVFPVEDMVDMAASYGSDVQKTLDDLSKRWMAVCQWTEKRSGKLTGLPDELRFIETEKVHFDETIGAIEKSLSDLEPLSSVAVANADEVLERVRLLKNIQEHLEAEHGRFVAFTDHVEQLSSKIEMENPLGIAQVKKHIGALEHRWDDVIHQMDKQSMITTSLQEVDTSNSIPKESTPSPLISTAIDTTDMETETQSSTVEESSSEVSGGESLQTQEELFWQLVHRFTAWLDRTEGLFVLSVPPGSGKSGFDDLSGLEQLALVKKIDKDAKLKELDLQKIQTRGVALRVDLEQRSRDSHGVHSALDEVNGRWRDLRLVLSERERAAKYNVDINQFRLDLREVDEAVQQLAVWADKFNVEAIIDIENVREALAECTEKLEVVKEREPQVESLQKRLERLTSLDTGSIGSPENEIVRILQNQFDHFTAQWAHVVDRISQFLETLTMTLEAAPTPSHTDAIVALGDWLDTVEDVLAVEGLTDVSELPVMKTKFDKLQSLRVDIAQMKQTLAFINESSREALNDTSSNALSIAEQIETLNSRFSDVTTNLLESLDTVEMRYRQTQELETKAAELQRWMDEVTSFLQSEDPATGDIVTLRKQMQQSEGLLKDIGILQPKLDRLQVTAKALGVNASVEQNESFNVQMDALRTRWESVCAMAKTKNKNLQGILGKSRQVVLDIESVTSWLENVEKDISDWPSPTSGKELQTIVKKHKQMKEEMNGRSESVENTVAEAELLIHVLEPGSETTVQLQNKIGELRERWNGDCRDVADRYKTFADAFELWKEFQELITAEKICLDELERKLADPVSMASDAEEYSEQLDLLERLMEGSGNHDRITEIGDLLINQKIMIQAVTSEMEKYNARRGKLIGPAKERQQALEVGAAESQHFEQQLFNCQCWIQHVDRIISSRLQSDIFASDVPEDYKQLKQEFDEHFDCVEQLEIQVERYRDSGKMQAAERLQEQIDHVKTQMCDVQVKFTKFQHPSDLDQRLDRAWRIVRDMEQSIDLLRLHSDVIDDVQAQQEKSIKIHETVAELKEEMGNVIATGKTLLDEPSKIHRADEFAARLNKLHQRYELLGSQLQSCNDGLAEAEKVLKQISLRYDETVRFLDETDVKMNSWEKEAPSTSVDDEIKFVETTQQEVARQESTLQAVDDFTKKWAELADPDVAQPTLERAEKLRHRWSSLQERLHKWWDSLLFMKRENEQLMDQFKSSVKDVSSWLEVAEEKICDFKSDTLPPDKMGEISRRLHDESVGLRTKLDLLRDCAVELSGRGEAWQRAVEPDLTAINLRWDSVMKDVKIFQRSTHSSMSPTPSSPTRKKDKPSALKAATPERTPEYPESNIEIIVTPGTPPRETTPTSGAKAMEMDSSGTMGSSSEFEEDDIISSSPPSDEDLHSISSETGSFDNSKLRRYYEDALKRFAELEVKLFDHEKLINDPDALKAADRDYQAVSGDLQAIRARHSALNSASARGRSSKIVEATKPRRQEPPLTEEELGQLEQKRVDVQRLLKSLKPQYTILSESTTSTDSGDSFKRAIKREGDDRSKSPFEKQQKVLNLDEELGWSSGAETVIRAVTATNQSTSPPESDSANSSETRLGLTTSFTQDDSLGGSLATSSILEEQLPEDRETTPESDRQPTTPRPMSGIDLLAELERLEHGIKLADDDLKQSEDLNAQCYSNFSKQEDVLWNIKNCIDEVETALDSGLATQVQSAIERDDPATDDLKSIVDRLHVRIRHVSQIHADKYNHYLLCFNCYQSFHREFNNTKTWLNELEEHLQKPPFLSGQNDLEAVEAEILAIEERISLQEKSLQHLCTTGEEMIQSVGEPEATVLREQMDSIGDQWQRAVQALADHKERLEEARLQDHVFQEELEDLVFWLDETEAMIWTADPLDLKLQQENMKRCYQKKEHLPVKFRALGDLNKTSAKIMASKSIAVETKEALSEELDSISSRLSKIGPELDHISGMVNKSIVRCSDFWSAFDRYAPWLRETRQALQDHSSAVLYTPMRTNLTEIEGEICERRPAIEAILTNYTEIVADSERQQSMGAHAAVVSDTTKKNVSEFAEDWSTTCKIAEELKLGSSISPSSALSESDSVFSGDQQASRLVEHKQQQVESEPESDFAMYAEINKATTSGGARQPLEYDDFEEATPEPPEYQRRFVPMKDAPAPKGSVKAFIDLEDGRARAPRTIEQLKELSALKVWLSDYERELTGALDVADVDAIREAQRKQQDFLQQLQTRRVQIIRILENAQEPEARNKAELLGAEWERQVRVVNKRRQTLSTMVEQTRAWDNLRLELELWLQESEQRLAGRKVAECTLDELKHELNIVEAIWPEVDHMKEKMHQFNNDSNKIIDTFNDDDSSRLSQVLSELNAQWSRLNDTLRVRRAVLEASLRGRQDFVSAVKEFARWLDGIQERLYNLNQETSNLQVIKDTPNRTIWIEMEKDLRVELNAHTDVFASLQTTGKKVLDSIDSAKEKGDLDNKLKLMEQNWTDALEMETTIRKRLETAEEQWEKLTTQLRELIYWIETKEHEILNQQPVGGDLNAVFKQDDFIAKVKIEVAAKAEQVQESIQIANSFLIQQDLRPRIGAAVDSLEEEEEEEEEPEATLRKQARRVAQQIRAETDTLQDRWNKLKEHSDQWHKIVTQALKKMQAFQKAMDLADDELTDAERDRVNWIPVTSVQLNDLQGEMDVTQSFESKLTRTVTLVDDVNDHGSRLLAESISLSSPVNERLEELNVRSQNLKVATKTRILNLQAAMRDFGPSSQHFLEASVSTPWVRAISENRVPYYMNHDDELTQWDHPKFLEFMDKLCTFNTVKFAAYRTGMKLRAMQKKLCLDLVSLQSAKDVFEKHNIKRSPDKTLNVAELVMILLDIYEPIKLEHPSLLRDLPLQIDICLNWLLNLYDPSRSGVIRVLSFKVAMVLLCKAQLTDKYNYLFDQVSTDNEVVDQKRLALLLYDCLQLPKLLGEIASFGGSNIEPSVRSCFSKAKFPPAVNLREFLDWLGLEPQSMVWMPVLHRVAAAETAKHPAKCNVCKMYPIIGIRYRCLLCFNFDMCQNCFFSQRRAKNHKLSHPMQEYCVVSSSSQDVKDFSKIVRNKLKGKTWKQKQSQRLAYLPVQTVLEGDPLESRTPTPNNPRTQDMHASLELYANRLAEVERAQSLSNGSGLEIDSIDDEHQIIASYAGSLTTTPVNTPKSPAQIVAAIDGMQKEELEAIVKQLEHENKSLQLEYEHLRRYDMDADLLDSPQATSSPIHPMTNGSFGKPPLPPGYLNGRAQQNGHSTLQHQQEPEIGSYEHEHAMLIEARALRQHKANLEARMRVLEDHNRQLEAQLNRLKQIIEDTGTETSSQQNGNYNSPPRSDLSISSLPRAFHLHYQHDATYQDDVGSDFDQSSRIKMDLMTVTEDLGRVMGNVVSMVNREDELSGED